MNIHHYSDMEIALKKSPNSYSANLSLAKLGQFSAKSCMNSSFSTFPHFKLHYFPIKSDVFCLTFDYLVYDDFLHV